MDRAALDVAIKLGFEHGGYCPKGRLAVDGPIAAKYHLKETTSSDYAVRTKCNIDAADATIIIIQGNMDTITDGTRLTLDEVKKQNKLYRLLKTSDTVNAPEISQWLHHNGVNVVNFAGPRESSAPGIYQQSYGIIEKILLAYTLRI